MISNSDKLVRKLTLSVQRIEDNMERITRREVAAVVGLMLFMAHTLNIDLAFHHGLMRAYANMFSGVREWDAVATELTPTFRANIRALACPLLANAPVVITAPRPPSFDRSRYDAVAIFDACQNAWAARIWLRSSGKVLRVLKAFSAPLKHSAHAEPTAAKELCKWLRWSHPEVARLALVTDHSALAQGQRRWWSGYCGFSTAFPLNEAFKAINGFAEVFHVDGVENICDGDSRSRQAALASRLVCHEVSEMAPELLTFRHPWLDRPPVVGF